LADAVLSDPLGRKITLHDRTWFGHILRGHPEMTSHKPGIEAAVTDPEEIRLSLSDPDSRQYYSSANESGMRFMVIVDVSLSLVKTAHFVKKIKGGALEWSKPTH